MFLDVGKTSKVRPPAEFNGPSGKSSAAMREHPITTEHYMAPDPTKCQRSATL